MKGILYGDFFGINSSFFMAGCAFSGRPLARGDWKFWWAIGTCFNDRPVAIGNKMDNNIL